jgi:N-acyl homoserine lactone hydrolase
MNPRNTIDRLYPLNGGLAVAPDRSVYTPGKWKGEQITFSCNCYLMHHESGWALWDTGISDNVAEDSGGKVIAHGIRGIVARTLVCQLADIGISPTDVTTVILSHAHFDHVGNAALFPHATWFIQSLEYAAMTGPDFGKYGYSPELYEKLDQAKIVLMEGDHDIFGDGAARVFFTPGHTPGHSSLLLQLANAGKMLLAADVAHYPYNLEHSCVPSFNSDAQQSIASMERLRSIVRAENAQLWLNHDIVKSATIPHAPAYLD